MAPRYDNGGGGSTVAIVAIIAILVLVLLLALGFGGVFGGDINIFQRGNGESPPPQQQQPPPAPPGQPAPESLILNQYLGT
jgi:hypothetical protein